MSAAEPQKNHPPPPSRARGCSTAVMIAIGVVLLLPGICGLFFISAGMSNPTAGLAVFISLGGLLLLVLTAASVLKRGSETKD
jgi:hypothetical protein